MTLPASIRVNTLLPFPAQITGNGPIAITKFNGIWTIVYNPDNLATMTPPPGDFFVDTIVVHNSSTGINFKMTLNDLVAAVTPVTATLNQRLITAGPATTLPTDRIINCNCAAPTTITLPSYVAQAGIPLTFKDVAGLATSNNITITAAGGELIDGQATIVLDTDYESITLLPAFDGTSTGWLEI